MIDVEHKDFRNAVRSLAATHVAPIADEVARTNVFPDQLRKIFADAELIQLVIPPEFGGPGGDVLAHCLAREEVSASGSLVLSQLAAQNTSFSLPIIHHGTDSLKERLLPQLSKGEFLTCIAITEPEAGSDPATMTTRARRDDSGWVLNGAKQFITWGSMADFALVLARTNEEERGAGISAFVVDTSSPGWIPTTSNKKMGQHGVPVDDIVLDGLHVPDDCLVGAEGRGFRAAMDALNRNRPSVAAQAVGCAQSAFDYAANYVQERLIAGKPVSDFQGIRWCLADMATDIEAARQLVYACANAWDSGEPATECTKLSSMAKLLAGEMVKRVTAQALQILGGAGYMVDHPLERYVRDAAAMSIVEGASEIQRNIIARALLPRKAAR